MVAGLGLVDGRRQRADHLHAEPFQDAVADQASIARFKPVCPPRVGNRASGRSFSITLATISQVRGSMYVRSAVFGIGHNRGRIGIHQHDFVPFLPQALTRLGAGIVEFAGLADNNRPGADQQNLM